MSSGRKLRKREPLFTDRSLKDYPLAKAFSKKQTGPIQKTKVL